mgnify:CR=1 FL=1
MNISILYGGASTEHKISIQTGLAVAEAIKGAYNLDMVNLEKEIYQSPHNLLDADLVFNALHGGDGENGTIQAYLDLHHIAYTGSGAKASKIAMDKNISKLIAQSVKIPTPKWVLIKRDPKGLYKKFSEGEIKNVAGMDIEFIPPDNPDLTIKNNGLLGNLLDHTNFLSKLLENSRP